MDGSVLVAHGGTEMGQSLNGKCLQIAAQELKVPLEAVFTSETSSNTVPNMPPTAASAGSDLVRRSSSPSQLASSLHPCALLSNAAPHRLQNGYAVLNACRELNSRIAHLREKLGPDAPMTALAGAAYGERISLSATGHYATPNLGYVWNVQERTGDLFNCASQPSSPPSLSLSGLPLPHTGAALQPPSSIASSHTTRAARSLEARSQTSRRAPPPPRSSSTCSRATTRSCASTSRWTSAARSTRRSTTARSRARSCRARAGRRWRSRSTFATARSSRPGRARTRCAHSPSPSPSSATAS